MSAAFVEQLKTKGAGKGKRKGSPAENPRAKAKAKAKAAAVSQSAEEADAGPALRVVSNVGCAETLIDEEGFMKYGVRHKERQRIRKQSASPDASAFASPDSLW